MGHHALGVDPRQALTGSRKSAGQSHLYVTRSKERLPTALAGLFLSGLWTDTPPSLDRPHNFFQTSLNFLRRSNRFD